MDFNREVFLRTGTKIIENGKNVREELVLVPVEETDSLDQRFRSHFGTSVDQVNQMWIRIDPFVTMPKGSHPKHIYWGLMLLKIYSSENVLKTLAGGPDIKTLRKWSWLFIQAISDLEMELVSFFCGI